MMKTKKRLVLVGGGHAHIHSLKHADLFARQGAEVVLIGPDQFHYYSGMGPGMLSRIYKPEQVRFNIKAMIESRGGVFKRGRVTSIDAKNRLLILEGEERIDYDLVSFNIGSHVPVHLISGAAREAFPVKPIENLERVRKTVLDRIRKEKLRILLIGGGAAGVELAGNIWRLFQDHHGQAEIILANSKERLLHDLPEKASRLAENSLSQREIRIIPNFQAASMSQGIARSKSGEEIPYDIAVLTTGILPPSIFFNSRLETSKDGGLLVNRYLQSIKYPEIFGGGDCISFQPRPLDRVGVYAVREAPILFHNLLASLVGKSLKPFRPQKKYLLIFNMGDDTGILVKGSFVWKSKLAFKLKDYIDTGFMTKSQES